MALGDCSVVYLRFALNFEAMRVLRLEVGGQAEVVARRGSQGSPVDHPARMPAFRYLHDIALASSFNLIEIVFFQ